MEARSAQQIWEAALGELQIQVSKPNYRTWLEKTVALSCEGSQFVIGVPNTFVAEYLDKNQRSLIEKVLTGLVRHEVQVRFRVNTDPPPTHTVGRRRIPSPEQTALPLFNPKYTFDSFVVGACNQLAHVASMGVAQKPGHNYNPLFIYGGAGLGKTHLLHAIGHVALANSFKVMYIRAEEYTNQLMHALREKKTADFRSRYRNVDMLLVDDVNFFSGKEQTGENFFHTFDALHNANHQIVVTSDCPPKSMPSLQDRLRSRYEWGLVTEINAPDFDTRMAILQSKAKYEGIQVSPDVLELIALQIQQNIRALEGSLNRVIAYARLIRTMVTPELAAQALKDIADNGSRPTPVTPSLITEAVVNSFQLTPSDLKGRKRDDKTVLARQVAMYLIRQETDCSLAEIGQGLGGRSPATVSHAYQKIASDISNDPSLRRKIFNIQQSIYSTHKS